VIRDTEAYVLDGAAIAPVHDGQLSAISDDHYITSDNSDSIN